MEVAIRIVFMVWEVPNLVATKSPHPGVVMVWDPLQSEGMESDARVLATIGGIAGSGRGKPGGKGDPG